MMCNELCVVSRQTGQVFALAVAPTLRLPAGVERRAKLPTEKGTPCPAKRKQKVGSRKRHATSLMTTIFGVKGSSRAEGKAKDVVDDAGTRHTLDRD